MPINFPASLDSLANPTATTRRNDPGFELHQVISNLNDIVEQLEAKLGTAASTAAANTVLRGTGAGATVFGQVQPADFNYGLVPACRVYRTGAQSITQNTQTAIIWDNEVYDTDTMHDNVTNNTRITFKTAGKYRVNVNYSWAGAGGAIRQTIFRWNGATYFAQDD